MCVHVPRDARKCRKPRRNEAIARAINFNWEQHVDSLSTTPSLGGGNPRFFHYYIHVYPLLFFAPLCFQLWLMNDRRRRRRSFPYFVQHWFVLMERCFLFNQIHFYLILLTALRVTWSMRVNKASYVSIIISLSVYLFDQKFVIPLNLASDIRNFYTRFPVRNRTIVDDVMRFTWYPRWTMGTSSLVDCGTWIQSRSAFSNVIQCPETWLERKPNTETSTNNGPGTFVRHRIIFDRLATASVNRGGGRVNDRATSAFRARFPRANNNCANLQVNPDLFFLF